MNHKNRTEKYFYQKRFSVLDILFLVTAIISAVVATFVTNGGPIGLPVSLISIAAFGICRSVKIKDAEIDQIQENIMLDNQIKVSDNSIVGYELKGVVVKKKKDGQLISPILFVTDIMSSDGETTFHIHEIDLIHSSVKRSSYCVKNTDVVFIEEPVKSNLGTVKMTYLKINDNCQIPVLLTDFKSSQLVKQICDTHEKKGPCVS